MSGGNVQQRITCAHNTHALFIVELLFEGGLCLAGCILAFKSRHLEGDFGEAKQLIIAMYNLAVVGSVVLIVVNVITTGQASKRILIAIGILWGSVFSSCAFVIPRLLQVRDDREATRSGGGRVKRGTTCRSNVHVSGIGNSGVVSSNSRASASQVRFGSSTSRKYSSADEDEEMMKRIDEEVFTAEDETNGDTSKAEQAEP